MICLKTTIFVVSTTTFLLYRQHISCCDLLENNYLCRINNNIGTCKIRSATVVICLKTTIFVVSTTTKEKRRWQSFLLWFAWKQLSLSYQQQQEKRKKYYPFVVICLKTTIFVVSTTTAATSTSRMILLWFAWKQLSLSYQQQRKRTSPLCRSVVICLKTTIFVVSTTTEKKFALFYLMLWFAWKQLSLSYQQQPAHRDACGSCGCDLLENNYLCRINNNLYSA